MAARAVAVVRIGGTHDFPPPRSSYKAQVHDFISAALHPRPSPTRRVPHATAYRPVSEGMD